ncbi:hypothetical protein Hanom_Chr02g00166591 [Helianthus anomalus]
MSQLCTSLHSFRFDFPYVKSKSLSSPFFLTTGEIHHIGIHRLRTGENPHLGQKPMNTRPKARQCGEVKPIQFKDRTSDRRLLA